MCLKANKQTAGELPCAIMFDGFVCQPLVEKKVNMPLLKLAGQESPFLSMSELSCSLLASSDQVLKRENVLTTNLLIG